MKILFYCDAFTSLKCLAVNTDEIIKKFIQLVIESLLQENFLSLTLCCRNHLLIFLASTYSVCPVLNLECMNIFTQFDGKIAVQTTINLDAFIASKFVMCEIALKVHVACETGP